METSVTMLVIVVTTALSERRFSLKEMETLLIQNNPVIHSYHRPKEGSLWKRWKHLHHLQVLIHSSRLSERRFSLKEMETICELFASQLFAPQVRKKVLSERDGNHSWASWILSKTKHSPKEGSLWKRWKQNTVLKSPWILHPSSERRFSLKEMETLTLHEYQRNLFLCPKEGSLWKRWKRPFTPVVRDILFWLVRKKVLSERDGNHVLTCSCIKWRCIVRKKVLSERDGNRYKKLQIHRPPVSGPKEGSLWKRWKLFVCDTWEAFSPNSSERRFSLKEMETSSHIAPHSSLSGGVRKKVLSERDGNSFSLVSSIMMSTARPKEGSLWKRWKL